MRRIRRRQLSRSLRTGGQPGQHEGQPTPGNRDRQRLRQYTGRTDSSDGHRHTDRARPGGRAAATLYNRVSAWECGGDAAPRGRMFRSPRGSGPSNKDFKLGRARSRKSRHSLTGRSTAASTPRSVTTWGPSVRLAFSNSLKRAFASCTCHVFFMTGLSITSQKSSQMTRCRQAIVHAELTGNEPSSFDGVRQTTRRAAIARKALRREDVPATACRVKTCTGRASRCRVA